MLRKNHFFVPVLALTLVVALQDHKANGQCFIAVEKSCEASAPTTGGCDGVCTSGSQLCGEAVVIQASDPEDPLTIYKAVISAPPFVVGKDSFSDIGTALCGFVTECRCRVLFPAGYECKPGFGGIKDWRPHEYIPDGDACFGGQ
jgi:hypothetical protein